MLGIRPILIAALLTLGACNIYESEQIPAPPLEPQPDVIELALDGCEALCDRLENPRDASGLGCFDACSVEVVERLGDGCE